MGLAMRSPKPAPSRASVNTQRYRARLERGEQVYKVALGPEVIEALIRWRWVDRELADDRAAVERAVEAGLIDAETAALLLFAAASSRATTSWSPICASALRATRARRPTRAG
jgi:hypothetical protein